MLHFNNSYSVQFNSDPRPLHQISTNGRSMPSPRAQTQCHHIKQTPTASHPYIIAQQKKQHHQQQQHGQKADNNQAISSTSSSTAPQSKSANYYFSRSGCRSQSQVRSKRKRKYIDTFEDDEDGQSLYSQSLIVTPPSKQHISEQTVMKSIRDDCKIDVQHIDLNSLDHTLNELSLDTRSCGQSRSGATLKNAGNKKRTFDEMVSECKDTEFAVDYVPCKKQKMWTLQSQDDHDIAAHSVDATECVMEPDTIEADTCTEIVNSSNNGCIDADDADGNIACTEQESLELIPSSIQYAELMNDTDTSLITKLSRRDSMLQRMSLNKYSGALVPYKKPMASKSWQELIQTYYKNNKHCNVKQFTEMTKINTQQNDDDNDCEMKESKRVKKKRRPIRLHSSYSGFANNGFMGSDELKQIANQCYVSHVSKSKINRNDCSSNKLSDNEHATETDTMDCD